MAEKKISKRLDNMIKFIAAANSARRIDRMAMIEAAREINKNLTEDDLEDLMIIMEKWNMQMVKIMIAVGVRKQIRSRFFEWYLSKIDQ